MRKFINWLTGRDIRKKLDILDIRVDSLLHTLTYRESLQIKWITKRLKASSMLLEAAMSAKRKEQS